MPFLGPTTYQTALLTTTNLEYLNQKLQDKNPGDSASRDSQLSDSLTSTDLSSPKGDTATPLSSLSSSNSFDTLQSYSGLNAVDAPTVSDNDRSQADTRTIVGDDEENRTIIIDCPSSEPDSKPKKPADHPRTPLLSLSTSSLSNLSNVASSSTTEIPKRPAPMVRKKSGELVKSSLRLPSLARSKSMPNTSKSVRFATHLEDVKFFRKTEKPTAVSRESSPVRSSFSSSKPVWDWDLSSSSDDDSDSEDSWELIHNDCPPTAGAVNFGRFQTGHEVILESVKLNSSRDALIGFVYVKNISYQKKVVVRMTTDDWKSYMEMESANYISSNHIFRYSDEGSNYDKFSFIIKVNTLCNFRPEIDVKFCIQYIVNNKSYWDNNSGKNFHLVLKKVAGPPAAKPVNNSNPFHQDEFEFRLKKNDNFNDSFSRPHTFTFQPKSSKHYLLTKIRTSHTNATPAKPIPKMHSQFTLSDVNRGLRSPRRMPLQQHPKSAADSEAYDYSQIIKNFCFCGSESKSSGYPSMPVKKPTYPSSRTDALSFYLS